MPRRTALKLLAAALPAFQLRKVLAAGTPGPKIPSGPFAGTRESLAGSRIPEWFRDAKFGIWAHWGPQSAPECGDWYARNLYIQGCRQNRYHLAHYGHPSKFGYKDVIPTWQGDLFDPEHLVGLYQKAGAKYFMSMGVHVDNFDLWHSKHTRWNAVNMGPKKDIVGLFRQAARRHGLRFGVSDHLWMAWKWMSFAHGSDQTGPLAGVPYDGADPKLVDLYGDCPRIYRDLPWDEDDISESWKAHWFDRIKDLIDQHEPDLIYSDGQIPFGEWGLSLVAHLYNQSAHRNHGEVEAVYTSKRKTDAQEGLCALDVERGLVDGIWPQPFQTDTCIGHWHYDREAKYKSPKRVIDMLVDVVSRNGNLLLNFPLTSRGILDAEELRILSEITSWMSINDEAIFATRPWKLFGEGPTVHKIDPKQKYSEANRKDLIAADVRFTTKGQTLYAFFMGWPEDRQVVVPPLAANRGLAAGRINRVALLGWDAPVDWSVEDAGLRVKLPAEKPCDHACVLKINGLEIK